MAPAHAIILTSYRRPWNMEQIAKACLATARPCDVFLIDNADDPALTVRVSRLPPEVKYLRSPKNLGPGHRFQMAAMLSHDFVMCIDDDIFLGPGQIDGLFAALARAPEHAHGVWGETVEQHWNGLKFRGHVQCTDREVDILNRVYAFTPALARRALSLAQSMGFKSWSDIGPTDDIFMSFAGEKRPLCHNFGALSECATANERGVAVWRRKGFYKIRRIVVQALLEMRVQLSMPKPEVGVLSLRGNNRHIQVS